jgi:hypothetical protein
MADFTELNPDQRREAINTQQRYGTLRQVASRARELRGSMVWSTVKGRDYLVRAHYDRQGRRRQTSLGLRSEKTELIKREYDLARAEADTRLDDIATVMTRQAAVNRALGLGRVPLLGARIIRALDEAGLLGAGLRVLGTYAVFAYEAVAGVMLDPGLATTEDIDLLLDTRGQVSLGAVSTDAVSTGAEAIGDHSLLKILQKVDRSFMLSASPFRAANRDGYLVDLIKPLRNPPWSGDGTRPADAPRDLEAVEIEGLVWHENAPPFEAVVLDDRGAPLRIVTSDPRVFAAHKLWLSRRADRAPLQRKRDAAQAQAVAALVTRHMPHLPFITDELRMLPKDVVDQAAYLFR